MNESIVEDTALGWFGGMSLAGLNFGADAGNGSMVSRSSNLQEPKL